MATQIKITKAEKWLLKNDCTAYPQPDVTEAKLKIEPTNTYLYIFSDGSMIRVWRKDGTWESFSKEDGEKIHHDIISRIAD